MNRVIRKPLIAFILISVGVGFVGNSNQVIADTATDSAIFSAQVNANCQLQSMVPVAFGSYDPVVTNATSPLDANGSFNIKCSKGGNVILSLDNGLNPTGAGPNRRMKSGSADFLTYNLYTTSDYSTIWNQTNTVSYGPTNGNAFTEIVYGRVPAAQINAAAGSYIDTVVITATY